MYTWPQIPDAASDGSHVCTLSEKRIRGNGLNQKNATPVRPVRTSVILQLGVKKNDGMPRCGKTRLCVINCHAMSWAGFPVKETVPHKFLMSVKRDDLRTHSGPPEPLPLCPCREIKALPCWLEVAAEDAGNLTPQ
jgi:hypothetical protein